MRSIFLLLLILTIKSAIWPISESGKPIAGSIETFYINPQYLFENRELYLQGNKDLNPAINRVLRLADEAVLDNTVYSVTKKPSDLLPPSADLHDYFSLARYYWPNKNSSNELPYYRVDGYTNPDIFDLPDSTWLQVVFNDVLNLGLAYFFTNNEIYAQKATVRLREWFINNSTKMNANLNFANWINGTAIGVVTGSIPMTKSGGLLDFSKLHYIIDGIGLIRNSESFTEEDYNSMVDWLTKYLHWLQTSPRGAFESSAQNNQGTWYDVQVVSILLFLGNIETAKKVQSTVTVGRISSQILSDGSEPLEQERVFSWFYSVFNLQGLFVHGKFSITTRANIYNYKTPQNVTILSALNYLLKHGMENGTNWPVKNLGAFDTKILTQISKDAYIQYFDVAYLNFANKMVKNNSYNWNPNRLWAPYNSYDFYSKDSGMGGGHGVNLEEQYKEDLIEPKMHISQAEMAKEKIPLAYRDYCAHLLPELNKCRIDTWYLPWHCKMEQLAWNKCQYDDYQRRMRLMHRKRVVKSHFDEFEKLSDEEKEKRFFGTS